MDPDKLNPFTLIDVTTPALLQLTYEPQFDTLPEQTLPVVGTLPVHVQEEIFVLAPKAADTAHIREFCAVLITGDEVGKLEGDVLGALLTGLVTGDVKGDVEDGITLGELDDGDTEGEAVGDVVQAGKVPKFLVFTELKQDA
jgi:hypothetical protein